METPQQEPRKIGGLDITRSIQDRIFLGVMGFIFMVLTGFVLYTYCTSPSPPDASQTFKAVRFFLFEAVLTVFLLALSCFIWGIAAPRWIEQFFHKAIRKFVWMLAFIAFLLLVLVGYIFYLDL
jgi:hypothetical protein